MRHQIRTMCPMSCHPTLCGMIAEVEDGKLLQITGDKANPDSQGFLCVRGQAAREVIDNPQRLLHPLIRDRRSEDAWREASWDEVLERIVTRIQAAGRERVGIWSGHGASANNYGTRIGGSLLRRFANLYGSQWWSGAIICWGMGGFGLGLTGVLETNTKEDMGQHSDLIVLWGANLASQPNTSRHLVAAKRRGAHVVAIDVRETEATAQADDVLLLRPGTDTALALALMHVIISEGRQDQAFIAQHTVGFEALAAHVQSATPAWAAEITGIPAEAIVALARRYASTRPAMIVIGGSSMHKGFNNWQAARAIACLPGLTGNLGIPGAGFGPRHGSSSHGQGLANIAADERRPAGNYIPSQMPRMTAAFQDGQIDVLLLFGANLLSSFADANAMAAGLSRVGLVVSHDLFMNDTSRRFADIILPGTAWLEELGCKMTNTHLYLMEQALPAPGQTRSLTQVIRALAAGLGLDDFFPWANEEALLDAILQHPSTGPTTVAGLRAQGGIGAMHISHVGHPTLRFATPSGKVEFYSQRAADLGLPPLPVHTASPEEALPLALAQGRTLTHFHSFYDHGRMLPSLATLDPEPSVWISPADAAARQIVDGQEMRLLNTRGVLQARAHVTTRVPAGTVWMRDGWEGLNCVTSGEACIPDAAVDVFPFAAGQAAFEALVEAAPL